MGVKYCAWIFLSLCKLGQGKGVTFEQGKDVTFEQGKEMYPLKGILCLKQYRAVY